MTRIERTETHARTLASLAQSLNRLGDIHRRLATGERIGSGADDPSGLVFSERLGAQIRGLSASIESAQRGVSLFRTAEGALSEASRTVGEARALAIQARDGSLSAEEREALQGSLDGALSNLSRIANTARFADQPLFSGSSTFSFGDVASAFRSLQIHQARLPEGGSPLAVSVNVTAAAASAQAAGAIAGTQSGDATFQVAGLSGVATVSVLAGATRAEVAQAINAASDQTGVVADEATGILTSQGVGSAAFVDVQNVTGTLTGVSAGRTFGADVRATVNGSAAAGSGNVLTVAAADGLAGRIELSAGTAVGTYAFQITGGGLGLPGGDQNLRVAFPRVGPESLGLSAHAGGLTALAAGGSASLLSDPAAADRILAAAQDDLARARGVLGGIQRGSFEAALRQLEVQQENTLAAQSRVRDTDYAATTSELVLERLKVQGQISSLRRLHELAREQVLALLGG